MERLRSEEDFRKGVVTYDLGNGQRVTFDERDVQFYGIKVMLKRVGVSDDDLRKRLPVEQGGTVVGTLPEMFDPMAVKSRTFLYDPRPGDFTLRDGKWVADIHLGMGDLEAIPEFRPS